MARHRDPAQLDIFYMRPRGKKGPKVMVYRDKRGRFIEVVKVDMDVKGLKPQKKRKRRAK
jgi:hypothetical protein